MAVVIQNDLYQSKGNVEHSVTNTHLTIVCILCRPRALRAI